MCTAAHSLFDHLHLWKARFLGLIDTELQAATMPVPWSIFAQIATGMHMASLRHATQVEVANRCDQIDMPVLKNESLVLVAEISEPKCGSVSNVRKSCIPNIWKMFASVHDDAHPRLRARTHIHNKSRESPRQMKVPKISKSWKASAYTTVGSVHKNLASAHSHQACAVALLYAHARIDNLIEEASTFFSRQDEPMIRALKVISGLCSRCEGSSDCGNRCIAAARACEDVLESQSCW